MLKVQLFEKVYDNTEQWQVKDFDLNSANGFQFCTTHKYKFNSKFCHNITLVFKFDTRFQVLYKYTFKIFQNIYNCTVLVALILRILVQICSSVLLCQIKYDCHVRNFYSKIQDKWSRLCFILPHIQTLFSTFV